MHQLALFAGSAATAIFMISQLPMLIKARRTKDLASYSFANIGLANLGNALYALYVYQMPLGPIWFMHAFSIAVAALMLFWYLRYARRPQVDAVGNSGGGLLDSDDDRFAADASRPRDRESVLVG